MKRADKNNDDRKIVCEVRLSSGDTDIPIILLLGALNWKETSTFTSIMSQVKIEKFWIYKGAILTYQHKKALVIAHAFTGNDYVASLLCK